MDNRYCKLFFHCFAADFSKSAVVPYIDVKAFGANNFTTYIIFLSVRISRYYYSYYHPYPLNDLLTEANFFATRTVDRITQTDEGTAI